MLVAISLALAVVPVTEEVVQGPRLTVGDWWRYLTNSSLASGFFLEGTATLAVLGHGPSTIEGTTIDAYRLSVVGAGTAAGTITTDLGTSPASGSWVLTGEEFVESLGMKTIASVIDLEASGTLHTQPRGIGFQLSVQNTTSYGISNDPWRFPLTVGTSQIVRSVINFSEDFRLAYGFPSTPVHTAGITPWNVTYTINASAGIDTPAGRFDAYPIHAAYPDGIANVFFFAPSAGNDVRTETYNGSGRVAITELTAYRYQATEPPRFLGLTVTDWGFLGLLAVAAAASVLILHRWLRGPAPRTGSPPPPGG